MRSEAPEAAEILTTFAELTEIQEEIARRIPMARWGTLVDATESGPPSLRLDRLLVDELVPFFADFLGRAADLGAPTLRGTSELTATLDVDSGFGAALAGWVGAGEGGPFLVRAFLQAVATTLASVRASETAAGRGRRCFTCGDAPTVGARLDSAEGEGARGLICGLCGSRWQESQLSCVHCGEEDPEKLASRAASSLPWVHLEECVSCGHYLKTVDLLRRPDAVPIVDELAAVELDEWARAHGLLKVQANLFGY